MFWRFAMLRFTSLQAHDHQKQDSCLGRKSLNVTNVPLCTPMIEFFSWISSFDLILFCLKGVFFFQKAAHLSKLSLLFILAERHFMSWIFVSGFSCLSCIELSSVLAFCLYVTFLLNLPGNMTLSDFVLKSFYNLTIYYASMWKS